jgi:hypothetical protein
LHATEGYAPTDFAHQLRASARAFPKSGEILDDRIRIILGFICLLGILVQGFVEPPRKKREKRTLLPP